MRTREELKQTDAYKLLHSTTVDLLTLTKAEMCFRPGGFWYFCMEFWDECEGEKMIYNWHLKLFADLCERSIRKMLNKEPVEHLMFNVPPGSGKTNIISTLLPAWLLAIAPAKRIISAAYDSDLANQSSEKTRLIMHSDKYKKYFPNTRISKSSDGKSDFKTTSFGGRYTGSVHSGVTGRHCSVVLADDILSRKSSLIAAEREHARNFIFKTLATRVINENVPYIFVFQRLHDDDPHDYILKILKGKITHICLPDIIKVGGSINEGLCEELKALKLEDMTKPKSLAHFYQDGLLIPNRHTINFLNQKVKEMGVMDFTVQYLENVKLEANSSIKREWFDFKSLEELNEIPGLKAKPFNMVLDTANTDNTKTGRNDASAACVFKVHNNHIYIYDVQKVFKSFTYLTDWIEAIAKEYTVGQDSDMWIEPKASGLLAYDYLKNKTILPIREIPDQHFKKTGKMQRLSVASGYFRNRRVTFLQAPYIQANVEPELFNDQRSYYDVLDTIVYAVLIYLHEEAEVSENPLS